MASLVPYTETKHAPFALKFDIIYAQEGSDIYCCISDEPSIETMNALSHLSERYPVKTLSKDEFDELKKTALEQQSDHALENFSDGEDIDESGSLEDFLQTEEDLLSSENSAPIIKYVNTLFVQANKQNATDIHVESYEKDGIIRFRIDGVLKEISRVKKSVVISIINRIKVISNLDISETRIPQDGRTKITVSKEKIDIRVSILPTYYGEKVVMRLLMKGESIPSLEALGFSNETYKKLLELLQYSYGMILITGPTGSGKSTTLHSFLKEVDHDEKNITTVEDPVEYNAKGINQVQVNDKVGLGFADALRSILRQDPDVVLVGEIRDKETAVIATQAAMTGHLLLSTLHTNNATGAISRLVDMGIDPFMVSSTLLGVIGQRLVRQLCPTCKALYKPTKEELAYFELADGEFYKEVGCEACNQTGFRGRKAIGEIILVDSGLKEHIRNRADEGSIKEYLSAKQEFTSMFNELQLLLQKGETSFHEALRIGVKER